MSLEHVLPKPTPTTVHEGYFLPLSLNFQRRYSQRITCHLFALAEAAFIALVTGVILANPVQEPLGGLSFAAISAIGAGAIALASALWTGAATMERFHSRAALLPGAVNTAIAATLAAMVGGANWTYILICVATVFASVYVARIPTALIKRKLEKSGRLSRLVAIVADDPLEREAVSTAVSRCEDVEIVFSGSPANLEALRSLSQDDKLDEIVLAGPQMEAHAIKALAGLAVTLVRAAPSDRFELQTFDNLRGTSRSPWNIQAAILMTPPLQGWGGIFKRAIDIVCAAIAIVLLSPILLACAIAIRLESPGPVFFVQERAGYRNKPFRMFKFRSMHTSCADLTGSQLTLRSDPRVTRVGNFLRRTSADELPQLFNVLRGEMSLVGPRPHPKGAKAGGILYDSLIPEFYSRYRMKPGITGLAQISGQRGNTETEQHLIDRFRSDLRYAAEWTPFLDISILFRTVLHLIKATNAF